MRTSVTIKNYLSVVCYQFVVVFESIYQLVDDSIGAEKSVDEVYWKFEVEAEMRFEACSLNLQFWKLSIISLRILGFLLCSHFCAVLCKQLRRKTSGARM